jgi:microcystin-dependent protein
LADPYVGEIRCFAGTFAPVGWATCDGQLLAISQNDTLFNLIGTIYGGDGTSTFALPNLAGRAPMHWGTLSGFTTTIGEPQGAATVLLTTGQIPAHSHAAVAQIVQPGGAPERVATPTAESYIGTTNPDGLYNSTPALNADFSSQTIGTTGGSQPHENLQPYLPLTFIISLFGIYPSQS